MSDDIDHKVVLNRLADPEHLALLAQGPRRALPLLVTLARKPLLGEEAQLIVARSIGAVCFDAGLAIRATSLIGLHPSIRVVLCHFLAAYDTADGVRREDVEREFERQGGPGAWRDPHSLVVSTQSAALARLVHYVQTARSATTTAEIIRAIFASLCGGDGSRADLWRLAHLDESRVHDVLTVLSGIYEGGELGTDDIAAAFADAGVPLALPDDIDSGEG
jgi:hypothetical protein